MPGTAAGAGQVFANSGDEEAAALDLELRVSSITATAAVMISASRTTSQDSPVRRLGRGAGGIRITYTGGGTAVGAGALTLSRIFSTA